MCIFVTKKREGRKGNWKERVKYKGEGEKQGSGKLFLFCGSLLT